VAIPESGAQRLEAGDVAREFEYPEDSQNPEDLSRFRHVFDGELGVEIVEDYRHVEW
jgi:hypothetical protein